VAMIVESAGEGGEVTGVGMSVEVVGDGMIGVAGGEEVSLLGEVL